MAMTRSDVNLGYARETVQLL